MGAGCVNVASDPYPGLGNNPELVCDECTGVAAVVDPQRDVDQDVEAAARRGCGITHAFETHLHNDFISGGRELAARHGATLDF
jgi:hydroxyacylglutathione hydrolase